MVGEALARAEELRRAGRAKDGIPLLLEALRYGEERAQVFFRLGVLFFELGDLSRAEHAFRRATEEDPRHASAHHNLGVVYRRQGKIAQSVKMLKKAQWLEVRYPRRADPAGVPKGSRRRWAWGAGLLLLPLAALLVWLLGRTG